MRLNYIEICGFRGFRDAARIDFGAGFTVLSGRNGVGKSTVFDAVEFALLGMITKYSTDKAANESVDDYVWWRGSGIPKAFYVTAAFRSDDGEDFVVTRSRDSDANKTPEEIESFLCKGPSPDNALYQLCRTSIIRDEWIAALSLDLSETQRFDLVRSALGSVEGPDFAAKAKAIVAHAEAHSVRIEQEYEVSRAQIAVELADLSQVTDAATRSSDIAGAMAALNALVPASVGDLAQRLDIARRSIPPRKQRLESMSQALFEGRKLASFRERISDPANINLKNIAHANLERAKEEVTKTQLMVDSLQRSLDVEESANGVAFALSALIEHGERLGLDKDHCPLCAAYRTPSDFQKGIAVAKTRLDALAANISSVRNALQLAKAAIEKASGDLVKAEAAWAPYAADELTLKQLEAAQLQIFGQNDLDFALINDLEGLEKFTNTERNSLVELERALISLENSRMVDRLTSTQRRVSKLREDVDTRADQLTKAQAAVTAAKSLERSVRRSSGEIVDERLALISPLLNELYQRLRPHFDWRTIEYSIRGDVRRFLSLKVGDGLNPQFVFSSGQRRAAGLAFLLSVHLARSWTRWNTLLLDDPVQHIDDFRALHLVEVLTAIRCEGRQIICAVEDDALADMLCRRLVSTVDALGKRVNVDTDSRGSACVSSTTDIPPMPVGIFQHPPETLAVG